jgi:hypothetical protein
MTVDMTFERPRRIQRVTLLQPVPGVAAGERVQVVDASTRGVRLAHKSLFSHGAQFAVAFEWDGQPIEFVGQVRWTKLQHTANADVYQSGFEIAAIDNRSRRALRGLVESLVERALDEQKANARGLPPLAPSFVPSGQSTVYARHEFINGVWMKTTTNDSRQPLSGFTVSATESRAQVQMLRSAYEVADVSMRHTIRKLAELSVSNPDGIPTRRYVP